MEARRQREGSGLFRNAFTESNLPLSEPMEVGQKKRAPIKTNIKKISEM